METETKGEAELNGCKPFGGAIVGRFVVAQPQLVPENVAVCPECGCRLYWQVMTEDGLEDLSLDCENEPEVFDDDSAWEADCHRNYQSDWQPIIDRVKAWIISANAKVDLPPKDGGDSTRDVTGG